MHYEFLSCAEDNDTIAMDRKPAYYISTCCKVTLLFIVIGNLHSKQNQYATAASGMLRRRAGQRWLIFCKPYFCIMLLLQ